MNQSIKKKVFLFGFAVALALMLFVEIFRGRILEMSEWGDTLYLVFSRALGGIVCIFFICMSKSKRMLIPKFALKTFLIFLPCMLVAVNNFPFITFFSGKAYISARPVAIIIYALSCICVSFFEEMAFRGCIFFVLLQRRKNR
jgi:membrane protease YdiL (CAAX protease family)